MAASKSLTIYEKDQIRTIKEWKNDAPDIVSQAMGLLTYPVTGYIQKVVPERAIQMMFNTANFLANHMADTRDISKAGKVNHVSELRSKDFKLSDDLAESVHNWAIGLAAVGGGAAGAAGIAGLAVDIPAVILLALRTVHKIGLCYGYECRSEMDKNYALGVMAASCANTLNEKIEALSTLRFIEAAMARKAWSTLSERTACRQLSREGSIIALRNLARQFGVNISKRKAIQAAPVIGALVGASVNAWYLKDVGWAARRSFQERWLIDNRKVREI